jgi:hypothetical protein
MLISVINLAQAKIAHAEPQKAIRAINIQIAEDFAPRPARKVCGELRCQLPIHEKAERHIDGELSQWQRPRYS